MPVMFELNHTGSKLGLFLNFFCVCQSASQVERENKVGMSLLKCFTSTTEWYPVLERTSFLLLLLHHPQGTPLDSEMGWTGEL